MCFSLRGTGNISTAKGRQKSSAKRDAEKLLTFCVRVCEGERLIIVLCQVPPSPPLSYFVASLLLRRVNQINATCNMKMPHALRFSRRVLSAACCRLSLDLPLPLPLPRPLTLTTLAGHIANVFVGFINNQKFQLA